MANEFFLGSQRTWYATTETYYGSAVEVKGTDAFKIVSGSMSPALEREMRPDLCGQSDYTERYQGRHSATWEVTKLFLPNGNAVTKPDDYVLWRNLFGNMSCGGTSIEFNFATGHDDSITIRDGVRTGSADGAAEFQQHVFGAIVNKGEISWGNQGNGGLAQLTFSGDAKKWGYTGNSTLGSGYSNVAVTTLSASTKNTKQFTVGSQFRLGGANTGGGLVVDTANNTTKIVTWRQRVARGATTSGAAIMVAHNPTTTTAGSPVHARLGYLSLNGSTSIIRHLGGRVTIEDNRGLLNEEVGYDSATQSMRNDRRNITFSLDFMLRKDEVPTLLGSMMLDTTQNLQVDIGDQPNKKLVLVMKNARFDVTPLEMGETGPARISMNGVALGTNGNDSLKVRIL